MPALFTRMSSPPKARTDAVDGLHDRRLARHIHARAGDIVLAETLGECLDRLGKRRCIDVRKHDTGTFR